MHTPDSAQTAARHESMRQTRLLLGVMGLGAAMLIWLHGAIWFVLPVHLEFDKMPAAPPDAPQLALWREGNAYATSAQDALLSSISVAFLVVSTFAFAVLFVTNTGTVRRWGWSWTRLKRMGVVLLASVMGVGLRIVMHMEPTVSHCMDSDCLFKVYETMYTQLLLFWLSGVSAGLIVELARTGQRVNHVAAPKHPLSHSSHSRL